MKTCNTFLKMLVFISALGFTNKSFSQDPIPLPLDGDTLWVHPTDYEYNFRWMTDEQWESPGTGAQSNTNGWDNTQVIVAHYGDEFGKPYAAYAAIACASLSAFGYDDWYLPAKDELQLLYDHKDAIGNFENTTYWSSTESSENTEPAWALNFNNNHFQEISKYMDFNVRCVRKNPPPVELDIVGYRFFSNNHPAFAEVLVNQGRGPFTFSWSNGDTTQIVNDLADGKYFVTVSSPFYSDAVVDSIEISASLTVYKNYVIVAGDTVWVSPEDAPGKIKWGENRLVQEGNKAKSKTNGVFNTLSIIEEYGKDELIAAYYCDSLNTLAYDDWYLPAEDELMALYNARDEIHKGFVADAYWSSTDNESSRVRGLDFSTGVFGYYYKTTYFEYDPIPLTRCVRRNNRFPDALQVELDTMIQPPYLANPDDEIEYTCFVQIIDYTTGEFELHCYFEEEGQFCRYIDGVKGCGTFHSQGCIELTEDGEGYISICYMDEHGMASSLTMPASRTGQIAISVSGGSGIYDIEWSSTDTLFDNDSVFISNNPLFLGAATYFVKVTDRYSNEQLLDTFVLNSYVALTADTIVCPGETVYFKSDSLTEEGTFPLWVQGEAGAPDSLYYFTVTYIRPHIDPICMVTIDLETGKNMVVWERTREKHTAQYNVYRETSFAGVYAPIGNVSFDSISLFVDASSIPEQQQYLYKITSVDICGVESAIEESDAHKTMLLQYGGSTGGINLYWGNRYEINGEPVSFNSYIIYRSTSSGSLDSLNIISGSNFAYTDTDPLALTQDMYYRVAGVRSTICTPASMFKASSGPFSQSISNIEDNRLRDEQVDIPNLLGTISSLTAYPNPFKDRLQIEYTLDSPGHVLLTLVNVHGKQESILASGFQHAGTYTNNYRAAQPGVYILRLQVGEDIIYQRVVGL